MFRNDTHALPYMQFTREIQQSQTTVRSEKRQDVRGDYYAALSRFAALHHESVYFCGEPSVLFLQRLLVQFQAVPSNPLFHFICECSATSTSSLESLAQTYHHNAVIMHYVSLVKEDSALIEVLEHLQKITASTATTTTTDPVVIQKPETIPKDQPPLPHPSTHSRPRRGALTENTTYHQAVLQKISEIRAILKGERRGPRVEVFDTSDGRGRGLRLADRVSRGYFVIEYTGERLTTREALEREQYYDEQVSQHTASYLFQVSHNLWIDATDPAKSNEARYINHSRAHANVFAYKLKVDNQIRLVFVALRDLPTGKELLCDYGERREDVLRDNPWLRE